MSFNFFFDKSRFSYSPGYKTMQTSISENLSCGKLKITHKTIGFLNVVPNTSLIIMTKKIQEMKTYIPAEKLNKHIDWDYDTKQVFR